MNESETQPWLASVRTRLDESTQALDAATLSRLNRARQAALTQRRSRTWRLPAAGLATCCALLLALVAWYPSMQRTAPDTAGPTTAAEVDSGVDEGIEFYQDLEFYAWLDAQEQDSGG